MTVEPEIRLIAERVERAIRGVLEELASGSEDGLAHLPLAQLRLLRALEQRPRNVCAAAEMTGSSPSAVSQMANRLCAAGLVEKSSERGDGRVRRLMLTDKARDLLQSRTQARVARMADLIERLDEDEARVLALSLERLTVLDAAREEAIH